MLGIEPIGHANEIHERLRLHLMHDLGALGLDGLLGGPEGSGNLLVQQAFNNKCHDVPLPRGQRRPALGEALVLLSIVLPLPIL